MSDADNAFPGFGKLVPGFDFLQTLAKQAAGSASQSLPQMPNLANWIAPTLNVEELDKRIQELKSVQFWLDQNATALKATVQALEVQKMTLATLKGMNFNMGDVANAFKLKVADKAKTFAGLEVPPSAFQASQAAADEDQADEEDEQDEEDEDVEEPSPPPKARSAGRSATSARAAKPDAAAPAGVVDPMQWWGALTQQFQTIAADAMKDVAKQTAVNATKGLAKDAVKTATGMARGVAKGMADSAGKTMAGGARAMTSALRSTQAWPTPGAAAPKAKPKAAAKKTPARKAARKTSR